MSPPDKNDTTRGAPKSDLRERLTEDQYRIAFEHGTERAFTGPHVEEKRKGEYRCVACGSTLWRSEDKFDSGTGWPSFAKPAAEGAVETQLDFKLIAPRTEVHCAQCGAHMGHVFPDGPEPTGLRYCINGTVLDFEPDQGDA